MLGFILVAGCADAHNPPAQLVPTPSDSGKDVSTDVIDARFAQDVLEEVPTIVCQGQGEPLCCGVNDCDPGNLLSMEATCGRSGWKCPYGLTPADGCAAFACDEFDGGCAGIPGC
jgi:hypothetical protein